jgi:predicted homoserine dehydrogenase-like protein
MGQARPAERSLAKSAIPIGLAHHVRLLYNIAKSEIVRWGDVAVSDTEAARAGREMEQRFAPAPEPAGMGAK